ncbi:MAG: dTMP kinase [Desulfuromonas sp.]|mgnify:CR=1 FL=1|nr:MAG: dTMP kinase [Desulfuromonas sp.]
MSILITFEGIEGSGKTTQISRLKNHLIARGHAVVVTREPGGCQIADRIRSILLDPANDAMTSRAELLLYAAARAQHVSEVIRPALQTGQIVLCDRFTDATLAYQGYGRKLDSALIKHLNELATDSITPDLTLLFDLPVERGLGRALQREKITQDSSEGRFEREALDFHRAVRNGYLDLAAAEPDRFRRIDADRPIDTIQAELQVLIDRVYETLQP